MSNKRKLDVCDEPHSKKRKIGGDNNSEEEEETAEERRRRCLNKKLTKQSKIRKNQIDNYYGYDNENNPFGDSNLTSLFLWKKKYEKHGLHNKQIKDIQKQRIKNKQQILKQEIEKTKQRRKQREKDKELEEKLHAELAKEMELEENAGWKEKEEDFHQLNAIKRSQIRISHNRSTAIDILAINIMQFKIDIKHHHKIQNPIKLINNLSLSELAQLLNNINSFISENLIGTNENEIKYWNMALLYTQYVFDKCNLIENENENDISSGGDHDTADMNDMNIMDAIERENLSSQSYDQLLEFEDLCNKMVSGRAKEIDERYANISVDVNYWTLALKIAKICKAKAFMIKEYKQYIKTLQINNNNNNNNKEENKKTEEVLFSIPELFAQEEIDDKDIPMIDQSHSMYNIYKEKAIDCDEDWEEIEDVRIKVLKQSMERFEKEKKKKKKKQNKEKNQKKENEDVIIDVEREKKMYDVEASRIMNEGEHSYNKSEEIIPSSLRKTYWWHDKYRPRKPRYFNRVKTGYSWNKYNQTHYDPDNPPPKIVQGYKFNIFYPDLIDATEAPTYKLYEKGNSEYAILIFHSGPPYQDIAFKIVNNEWEPSHRRGFRCRFEKGIFSLYFNFMRYRYRR